jgi:Baseplate J-like protein
MPLPLPLLDDRSQTELLDDLLARIPAHTPEWTHQQPGDPGRTLLELFAFLGDALLYRVNQIPLKQRRAFLNLIGQPRRAARPARCLLQLALPDEARSAVELKARAICPKPVVFETLDEIAIAPVVGEVYLKRRLQAPQRRALDQTLGELQALYGPQPIEPYAVAPLFADGRAVPAGVDVVGEAIDGCVWIALLTPPPRGSEDVAALRERCAQALARNDLLQPRPFNLGLLPSLGLPDEQQLLPPRGGVPLLVEMSLRDANGATAFGALLPLSDSTAASRQPGVLRLLPPSAARIGVGDDARAANERSGVGLEPPRLDDPGRQARLIAWLRVRPDPAFGPVSQLRLSWLGLHAVRAEGRHSMGNLIVADADGLADLRVPLPVGDVDEDSLRIELAEDGSRFEPWQRVDDLGLLPVPAARDARAYELDAQAGELRFGDGLRGRVPPLGSRIKVVQLRTGGGAAGNLPAGTLQDINPQEQRPGRPVPRLRVLQPADALGGEDAETIEAAENRLSHFLRHRERAVTEADYRVLAAQTPGAAVGRVALLPRFKPHTRQFDIPGVVSVLVLPAATGVGSAPNPRADRPLIEAVHAHLDARRPLATELYVIGCEYQPIGVTVAVGLRDDSAHDATLHAVRDAIAQALWPLPPGGFDGQGWPLGRSVIDRELAVAVARVPGVASVPGLSLFVPAGGSWQALPRNADGSQQLALQAWQLPELLQMAVVDAAQGELASAFELPAPDVALNDAIPGAGNLPGQELSVAVPIVPDLC